MAKNDETMKMQETLAKIFKEETRIKNQAYREKIVADREEAMQIQRDEASKQEMYTDPASGKEMTYHEAADRKASQMLSADQNSYNDWRANMIGLLNLFTLTVGDLTQRRKGFTNEITGIISELAHAGVYKIVDSLVDAYKNSGSPKIDFKVLADKVHFTDDNKLEIDPVLISKVPKDGAVIWCRH